jgi:hypothetical protein
MKKNIINYNSEVIISFGASSILEPPTESCGQRICYIVDSKKLLD